MQSEPKLLAVYLHGFNMRVSGGWPELSERLASDEHLKLA